MHINTYVLIKRCHKRIYLEMGRVKRQNETDDKPFFLKIVFILYLVQR